MVLARDVEYARLTQIIKELQRHRFGRRAEILPEDQLLLGLEEAEQIEAAGEEDAERADSAVRRVRTASGGRTGVRFRRICLAHREVIDIEDHAYPCCRNGLR
ncbi:transposase domain-containing protein [Mesorhizobium sp. f-mel]